MEYAACHVVYLDKSILHDMDITSGEKNLDGMTSDLMIQSNLKTLLSIFKSGTPPIP